MGNVLAYFCGDIFYYRKDFFSYHGLGFHNSDYEIYTNSLTSLDRHDSVPKNLKNVNLEMVDNKTVTTGSDIPRSTAKTRDDFDHICNEISLDSGRHFICYDQNFPSFYELIKYCLDQKIDHPVVTIQQLDGSITLKFTLRDDSNISFNEYEYGCGWLDNYDETVVILSEFSYISDNFYFPIKFNHSNNISNPNTTLRYQLDHNLIEGDVILGHASQGMTSHYWISEILNRMFSDYPYQCNYDLLDIKKHIYTDINVCHGSYIDDCIWCGSKLNTDGDRGSDNDNDVTYSSNHGATSALSLYCNTCHACFECATTYGDLTEFASGVILCSDCGNHINRVARLM